MFNAGIIMVSSLKPECSFPFWYPQLRKISFEATVLRIPNEVLKYLEHDAFVLPVEATNVSRQNDEWTDGSPVVDDEVNLIYVWKY